MLLLKHCPRAGTVAVPLSTQAALVDRCVAEGDLATALALCQEAAPAAPAEALRDLLSALRCSGRCGLDATIRVVVTGDMALVVSEWTVGWTESLGMVDLLERDDDAWRPVRPEPAYTTWTSPHPAGHTLPVPPPQKKRNFAASSAEKAMITAR